MNDALQATLKSIQSLPPEQSISVSVPIANSRLYHRPASVEFVVQASQLKSWIEAALPVDAGPERQFPIEFSIDNHANGIDSRVKWLDIDENDLTLRDRVHVSATGFHLSGSINAPRDKVIYDVESQLVSFSELAIAMSRGDTQYAVQCLHDIEIPPALEAFR